MSGEILCTLKCVGTLPCFSANDRAQPVSPRSSGGLVIYVRLPVKGMQIQFLLLRHFGLDFKQRS